MIVWPGSALSSTEASTRPACGVPVLPTTSNRSSATLVPSTPAALAAALTARVWSPATTTASMSDGSSWHSLKAAVAASVTSGR